MFFFFLFFRTDVGHSEAVGGWESAHSNGGTQPSVAGAFERASRLHWFPIAASLFRYFTAGQEQRWIEVWRRWKHFPTLVGWIGGWNFDCGHFTQRLGSGARQSNVPVDHDGCGDVLGQRRRIELLRKRKARPWLAVVTSPTESRSGLVAHFSALPAGHDDDGQLRNVAGSQPLPHLQRHQHSAESRRKKHQSVW